ncbi:MAG TPA: ACT domain-containing protein [Tepidisphaeraceae bacterium]|jgi:glycine cleavage system regulatory protein
METTRQVATITGHDRPGIIDDVCTVIDRNSGRVLDLRSSDVAGCFAMLALYECAATAGPAIEAQLGELASVSSMGVSIHAAEPCDGRGTHLYRLVASGVDHVGVLRRLSHLLRVLSINIEQIDTRSDSDAKTTMTLTLSVPRNTPLTKLREFVGQLLASHQMDWELKSI